MPQGQLMFVTQWTMGDTDQLLPGQIPQVFKSLPGLFSSSHRSHWSGLGGQWGQ